MNPLDAVRRATALAALLFAATTCGAGERCAEVSAPISSRPGDGLRVSREGAACVITVEHRRGIGAARIVVPVEADALVLRFSGFAELENLGLSSPAGNLLCELERPEGATPVRRCRMDGAVVPGPQQTAGGLEFRVPARFTPLPGEPLELHWVDFWR